MVIRGTRIKASTVRLWYRIHKWSSLICTAFLLMACITGFLLYFRTNSMRCYNHMLRPPK